MSVTNKYCYMQLDGANSTRLCASIVQLGTTFFPGSKAWGCGSNDGRCGVERFLNKKGEGKPPEAGNNACAVGGGGC